jgi:hypothetical protein
VQLGCDIVMMVRTPELRVAKSPEFPHASKGIICSVPVRLQSDFSSYLEHLC